MACRLPRQIRRLVRQFHRCWPVLLACSIAAGLIAQQTPADASYTFKIEANLIQIPVLVLSPSKQQLRTPVAGNRFSIRLGNGAPFKPKYVHAEGEDPINLAIVLDARSPQSNLLPKIDRAISDLAPGHLRSQDRVSIYVIDCSFLTQVEDIPADSAQLMTATGKALDAWSARKHNKDKAPCNTQTHLWDFLAHVTNRLAQRAGWRVLLAITDGDDKGSELTLDDLTNNATYDAVTIFGLTPVYTPGSGQDFLAPTVSPANARPSFGGQAGAIPVTRLELGSALTKPFSSACERTGGLVMSLANASLSQNMQQMITMLRNRYILEFPRPNDQKAGSVVLSVSIDGLNAFIRPAGDGVPVAEKPQAAAPTATPSDSTAPPSPAAATTENSAGQAQTDSPPAR